MFVWVIQCIVKLMEFYRDSAPLIVDLFKYPSKHSLLSLYSTITRYWDDIVLTGVNLCSFCYCLFMFILRRKSNGWEGRLSLTGLTASHFCDCPKHVFFVCSMIWDESQIVHFVDIGGIVDRYHLNLNFHNANLGLITEHVYNFDTLRSNLFWKNFERIFSVFILT